MKVTYQFEIPRRQRSYSFTARSDTGWLVQITDGRATLEMTENYLVPASTQRTKSIEPDQIDDRDQAQLFESLLGAAVWGFYLANRLMFDLGLNMYGFLTGKVELDSFDTVQISVAWRRQWHSMSDTYSTSEKSLKS